MRMADALAAVAEEDRPRVQASIDRMLRGARDSFATVVRWHGHDGELHWVETRGEAVRDEDGNVLRIVGTSRLGARRGGTG
jgi:PAS domain S-box-containing protein